MSTRLKIYYDKDIATVTYNGGYPFESGTSYSFDGTSYTKLFSYVLKNNATLPSDLMYFFWGDNKYFIYETDPMNGSNKYDFSESTVVDAYQHLVGNDSNISPFLCLISARYSVNGELNTKRPLIVCGDYASKNVVTNGNTDTITVTFDKHLTNVKLYYRDSNGGQYKDYNQGISADKHTFTATVPHIPITNSLSTDNDYSFIVVPTVTDKAPEQPTNSTNITVQYNNGENMQTITYPNQAAGTITGTVKAASGYHITKVSGGHYRDQYGYSYTLSNFTATKVSDTEYSYSFNLTSTDISRLQKHPSNIVLAVTTEKEAGNLTIDASGLVNCSIMPSVITQDKETAITLNANSGYILNGSGTLIVDGKTTNFICNNVASFPLTVIANTSVKIVFTASKVETPPQSIIHTYVLNQDGYNNLGKQVIMAVNSTGSGFEQYDYTKFINYLFEFPFKIDNSITTSTSSIQLGKQALNITAKHVTHETIDIDLGTINLTAVNDSNDLKPVSIMLYCPFSEQIVLPSSVIGSKLNISYTCNLKNEQALLIVKQNNNAIYSAKTELFTDLPLYFTAGTQDTLIKEFKKQYQNTIEQAYIRAVYHKPIQGITVFDTKEHGKLNTFKGFTRVTHGTLSASVSSEIDTMILQELHNGVIIK